jgi:hypothetical protein
VQTIDSNGRPAPERHLYAVSIAATRSCKNQSQPCCDGSAKLGQDKRYMGLAFDDLGLGENPSDCSSRLFCEIRKRVFSEIIIQLLVGLIFLGLLVPCANGATLTHSAMVGAVTDTSANIWIRSDVAVTSAVVQYQPTGGNWSQPSQSASVSLVVANDFTGTLSLSLQ